MWRASRILNVAEQGKQVVGLPSKDIKPSPCRKKISCLFGPTASVQPSRCFGTSSIQLVRRGAGYTGFTAGPRFSKKTSFYLASLAVITIGSFLKYVTFESSLHIRDQCP
jgi:hypothetical protein